MAAGDKYINNNRNHLTNNQVIRLLTRIDANNKPFLKTPGNIGPVGDPDFLQFISIAAISDPVEYAALNFLTLSWKGIDTSFNPLALNLWTPTKILYPFNGGLASSTKFNLRDSRDTDDAFRITFSGGITHSSTGVKGNGINCRGNTHFVPSLHGNLTAFMFGRYFRIDPQLNSDELIGCFKSVPPRGMYEFNNGTGPTLVQDAGAGDYPAAINTNMAFLATQTGIKKFSFSRLEGTTVEYYNSLDGLLQTTIGAATTMPDNEFDLFCINSDGSYNNPITNEYAGFCIANFGTLNECLTAQAIMNQFNVMLGRNV